MQEVSEQQQEVDTGSESSDSQKAVHGQSTFFFQFSLKIFYNMDHRIHKIDSRFNLNSCFDFSVALFSDQSKNWHLEKKRQFN